MQPYNQGYPRKCRQKPAKRKEMHNKIYRNEPEYRQNYRNGTKCAEVDQYDAGNFKNEQKYYQNKKKIP